MSTSDRTSLVRQIADIEGHLARLQEQRAAAEETLRSLRKQLERDDTVSAHTEERSENAHPTTAKDLSPDEKISLFLRLFRGRGDVYPRLWQNQKTGKKGYAPACANEWVRGVCEKPRVKCGECPNQAFLPVTADVILDHLRGRHVIGVYPMLKDETCWFLAADFDKEVWREDVLAFTETCRRVGVPYAIERSRSGNGAHVWFFFSSSVFAATARKMGSCLTEAMQTRVLDDIAYYLQPPGKAQVKRPPGPKCQGYEDMVRLAGALERVPVDRKIEIGEWLLTRLKKSGESPQSWWAVGRIGSRVPFHGSAHNVVPPDIAHKWLERLLKVDWKRHETAAFAAAMIARVSGDRERDLNADIRQRVVGALSARKAPDAWLKMISHVVELSEADERRAFGESLPPGLKLIH